VVAPGLPAHVGWRCQNSVGRIALSDPGTQFFQGPDVIDDAGIVISSVSATSWPDGPPGRGDLQRVTVTPGNARWSFIEFPPGCTTAFHHTDSLDFDVVIDGSVDLILDDGAHRLGPGDGVVVKGVDHSWATHEEGCRMSVVVIGTPPLE
jgi:quercetin dioxygenase-like cupin family protein